MNRAIFWGNYGCCVQGTLERMVNTLKKVRSSKRFPLAITGFLSFLLMLGLHKFFLSLPSTSNDRPYLDINLRLVLAIFLILLVCSQYLIKNRRWKNAVAIGLLSVFLSGSIIFSLKDIPYGLNGIRGDQSLRTAYITKFANYPGYVDLAYKDLPSFYPPLYYYILGKAAIIVQKAPYLMNRWGLFATVFSLPYITYALWNSIVGEKKAVAVSYILLLIQWWYKPSGWLSLMMFVPWWLYYVEGVSLAGLTKKRWRYLFVGAILGSLIFQVYYYWFFVGGMSLLVAFFNHANPSDQGAKGHLLESVTQLASKLPVLLLTMLFSGMYWIPYLSSMVQTGGWEQLQTRNFSLSQAVLPFPFLDFSIEGAVWLLGFVYLLITFRKKKLSLALINLLIAVYLWYGLGFVGVLIDKPLMANISQNIMLYSLSIAFVLGAEKIFEKRSWEQVGLPNGRGVCIVASVVLIAFFGQKTVDALATSELLENAKKTNYPSEQISAFLAMVEHHDQGRVILADPNYQYLSVYLPTYQFLSWSIHYSHPAALYKERVEFLLKASQLDNPALFAAAIMNNKYSHIDYIIPEMEVGKYRITYDVDTFPYGEREIAYLLFEPDIFDDEYFTKKERNELLLLFPNYENDPIDSMNAFLESGAKNSEFGAREEVAAFFNDFDRYLVDLSRE